jgi:RND family efflux transporter MFP subunit
MTKTLLIPVLFPVFLLAACGDRPPETAVVSTPVTAPVLTVAHGDIREDYATTGTLIADDRIEIASRIIGLIRQVNVHEGSQVKKGQLLLSIDPTEIQAQMDEAQARLAQSQAQLDEAQVDIKRYQSLYADKVISVDRFRKAELALQLATGEKQAAEATLERIQVQMQYASIRSPVNGVVVARHKQAGDIATPGAPILTIENPDNVVVRTFIKEQHIQHIRLGDTTRITIDAAGLESEGIITQIVPSADPGTHSYMVKIALQERGKARTGMFVRIDFKMGHTRGILIPTSSVISRADLNGVYIIDSNNIAHYRMVRIGRRFNNSVEILTGLQAGDRIVSNNPQRIHSGDRILLENHDQPEQNGESPA